MMGERVYAVAIGLADYYPGFEEDSYAGEVLRFRLKRALHRQAPGHTAEEYEQAIRRAGDLAAAIRRASSAAGGKAA